MIPEKKPVCNAFPCPRGIDRTPETCYCSIQKRLRRRHVPASAAHHRERLVCCKSLCAARPDTASEPQRGNALPGSPVTETQSDGCCAFVSRVEPWSVQRLTPETTGVRRFCFAPNQFRRQKNMSENNEFSFENPQYRKTYWHTCSHVMAQADRKSTRLNSSHEIPSRMPSSA